MDDDRAKRYISGGRNKEEASVNLSKKVLRAFRWFICPLSSVVKSVGVNKFSYRQVPGSIPAENTFIQIHMDLSK